MLCAQTFFSLDETGAFHCPNCDWAKKDKPAKVVRHLLQHLADTDFYPYKCPVEGCDFVNTNLGNVHRHVHDVHKLEWTQELVYAPVMYVRLWSVFRRMRASTRRRRH